MCVCVLVLAVQREVRWEASRRTATVFWCCFTCTRSKDEFVNDVILWTPTYGHISLGHPTKIYISSVRTLDATLKSF